MTTDTLAPANGQIAAPGQNGPLPPPMFYTRPEPVQIASHADVKVRPEFDYGYAADINTVPVTVPEFMMVARHYPIMFLGPELVPTAALGFAARSNLFVNANGEWAHNQYVPAYIRRFPFILLSTEGNATLHLGIDAAARSDKPGARPLFEGDKQTDVLTQGIALCEQFHGAFLFTQEFTRALAAAGIMEERGLEVQVSPGQMSRIGTFQRVNEDKFKALPDATVLDWHHKGYMYAVYFHLQSMNNWDLLMARQALLAQAAASVV